MSYINLLPAIETAVAQVEDFDQAKRWELPIRSSVNALTSKVIFIEKKEDADDLIMDLQRYPINAIAIDTEFGFSKPSIEHNNRTWHDVRSQVPLLLSGAAWMADHNKTIRFVFDLSKPELLESIKDLLNIPAPFIGHNLKAEFQTFWSLGLEPLFHQTYDTWVAAKMLTLGHHKKRVEFEGKGGLEDEEQENPYYVGTASLLGQSEIYNIPHRYSGNKKLLAKSFLNHPAEKPFSERQIDYAAADAEATLELYKAQQKDIITKGLQTNLYSVEFPYVEANARMEWDGVLVDRNKARQLRQALDIACQHHLSKLQSEGIENPNSHNQVIAWIRQKGLGDRIKRQGKYTSKDEVLEQIESLDPAITDIRRYRKYSKLRSDILFNEEVQGVDGRVHPTHRHLGADTTRNSCSMPNIVGITKTFRPVVIAPAGRALVELDYAQIEVGICAAVYRDEKLTSAFNSGDVYAAVAQQFYRNELTEYERSCTPSKFKNLQPELRNKIKVFVLAVMYNMQAQSIADRFKISLEEAERQRNAFLDTYPSLRDNCVKAIRNGQATGYASICGGPKRFVPSIYNAKNLLINTPVQGSAAVAFRNAVVQLYQHFRGTTTKLVLPVHDAVLIECDEDIVESVCREASQIMASAVRSYFPQLQPVIDINDKDTTCWNKDGQSDSLEKFMDNPEFKLQ